jgi:hypothetical protein
MNLNFSEVLTRAWQITWKYKVLWIFGVLASCNSSRGSYNFNNNTNWQQQSTNMPPAVAQWSNWIVENLIPFIAILTSFICILTLLSIFLGSMGRLGLIRGTVAAEGGAEHLSFGVLFKESLPFFWRSFWLWFMVGAPFIILALLVAGLLAIGGITLLADNPDQTNVLSLLAVIPFAFACFCFIGILSWLVRLIAQQGQVAIVVENLGTIAAIRRGWEVFKKNIGSILLMAIILAVIGFVVGLVFVLPFMALIFPTMFAFILGRGESTTPLILLGLGLLVLIPLSVFLNGVFNTFLESSWTLTYLRLTRKPEAAPAPLEANV